MSAPAPRRKGFSLSLRIQVQIGLAIALVITGGTYLNFRQTLGAIRTETVNALQSAVATRAGYESRPFVEAQNNTEVLRDEYLHRLDLPVKPQDQTDFDTWFARSPDGLTRVRPALDNHKRLPSIYIRAEVDQTPAVKRNVMVAFDLLHEWGPVLTQKYYSAYIDLPGISLIMFAPSVNWGKEADATTNNMDYPPVQNSAPSKNPARRNTWTEFISMTRLRSGCCRPSHPLIAKESGLEPRHRILLWTSCSSARPMNFRPVHTT